MPAKNRKQVLCPISICNEGDGLVAVSSLLCVLHGPKPKLQVFS